MCCKCAPFRFTSLRRFAVSPALQVGLFKGLVRVVDSETAPPLLDMDTLLKPKPYVVRVYVLKGHSFMGMDDNGLSDPYLKLKLGKVKINDKKNYLPETVNPEFFRCFEINTTLPGPSSLEIEAWDYDTVSGDDFIGKTTIDLEDRLFHKAWKQMGMFPKPPADRYPPKPGMLAPGSCVVCFCFFCFLGPLRFHAAALLSVAAVERRSLYNPTSSNPQGSLELWVDILTASEAKAFPKIKIEKPPPTEFEVRVWCLWCLWCARFLPLRLRAYST